MPDTASLRVTRVTENKLKPCKTTKDDTGWIDRGSSDQTGQKCAWASLSYGHCNNGTIYTTVKVEPGQVENYGM